MMFVVHLSNNCGVVVSCFMECRCYGCSDFHLFFVAILVVYSFITFVLCC